VSAISGNDISLRESSGTVITVVVSSTTTYQDPRGATTESSIVSGDRLKVYGTIDSSGNLDATAITIRDSAGNHGWGEQPTPASSGPGPSSVNRTTSPTPTPVPVPSGSGTVHAATGSGDPDLAGSPGSTNNVSGQAHTGSTGQSNHANGGQSTPSGQGGGAQDGADRGRLSFNLSVRKETPAIRTLGPLTGLQGLVGSGPQSPDPLDSQRGTDRIHSSGQRGDGQRA
jgi:hypothetical protein